MKHVFDANRLPGMGVAIGPHRIIHLARTSMRYGCRIEMRREPQRAI